MEKKHNKKIIETNKYVHKAVIKKKEKHTQKSPKIFPIQN